MLNTAPGAWRRWGVAHLERQPLAAAGEEAQEEEAPQQEQPLAGEVRKSIHLNGLTR